VLYVLFLIFLPLLALHLYRQHWTHRNLSQMYTADFNGELYRAGETVIARRPAQENDSRTVVCFPGFLEDMRYFQALYANFEGELILVNNADYHCPFSAANVTPLQWPENPYALGSIEHDGFYLAHTVQNLAGGSEVAVHGHSRGGAVVLEAGRQFPEIMQADERQVTAVLEAAVLPQAKTAGKGSEPVPHRLICYFLPIVLGLSRRAGVDKLLKQPMMRPTNDLKTELCLSVYSNARHYSTCVANVRSLVLWQKTHDYTLYSNYRKVVVLLGARDDVLDNASMLASAKAGSEVNPGVSIVQTQNTNHFISLEQPHYLWNLH
jgi:pimeloyl-ACP methyl ester carboxylesterase